MKYAVLTGVTVQLDSDGDGFIHTDKVVVHRKYDTVAQARAWVDSTLPGIPVAIIPVEG